jgi:hypothetical protein
MGNFNGLINLEALPDGEHWKTLNQITYTTDSGLPINVPAGFVTDLASVPRVFWNIFPPFGKYDGAAIVHDYLYTTQILDRWASDKILLEAMKAEGVNAFTRWTFYELVRAIGWSHWNQHTKGGKND